LGFVRVNKIYKKFLLWLMQTKFYWWMTMRVIPHIRFSMYYTDLRGWKYHRFRKLVKPGDIVVCIDYKKLTKFLVPGEFTHAAFVVGLDSEWEVSEMTHLDYTRSHTVDLFRENDRIVVLRCRDWDEEYTAKVIENCKSFKNAKYDTDFRLGIKALYCSELVYLSDSEKRLQVSLDDLGGIGREYISPTGLYKAKNVDVIWDSRDEACTDTCTIEHK